MQVMIKKSKKLQWLFVKSTDVVSTKENIGHSPLAGPLRRIWWVCFFLFFIF